MNKITTCVCVVVIALFACWYLPVSFVNVFACDDFWHGTNVIENGFFLAQLRFYLSWEGSFTHTFLVTIPHLFKITHVPFLFNMFALCSLVISICLFIRTYCCDKWSKALGVSLFAVTFFLVTTSCGAEIRFWMSANLPYLFGVSTILVFMACYRKMNSYSLRQLLLLWFLLVLIVGNKVTYIVCVFVCMLMNDVVFKTFSRKKLLLLYLPALMFAAINIAAPGNYKRLSENLEFTNAYSVFDVIAIRFMQVIPMSLWALVFPPFLYKEDSAQRRTLIVIMSGVAAFFLMESLVVYFCFRDPGPLRTYVLSEIFLMTLVVVVRDALLRKIGFGTRVMGSYLIACGIVLFVVQLNLIWQVSPTRLYAKKANERDYCVKAQLGSNVVQVQKLPPSCLLLSYFANDTTWIKNVYLPYFRMKGCDVEIVCQKTGKKLVASECAERKM